jgi:hypothetical protein
VQFDQHQRCLGHHQRGRNFGPRNIEPRGGELRRFVEFEAG